MKKIVIFSTMVFLLVFSASIVSANLMEFDVPANYGFTSYTEDGINLTVINPPAAWGPSIYSSGSDNYLHIDGALFEFDMGGSLFDLSSFDAMQDTGGNATVGVGAWSMGITLGVMDFSAIPQFQNITSFWIDTGERFLNGHFELDSVTTSTSVPEPATILLLGTSLIGLAAMKRRFKN